MRKTIQFAMFLGAAAAVSTSAMAHSGHEAALQSGFLAGFSHPLMGWDHLVTMLAVGMWSALTARRAGTQLIWAPLGFATLLLVGALLAWQGVGVPVVEPMIAASLITLGLLLASRSPLGPAIGAGLVAAFAVFHGVAHGQELMGAHQAVATLMGLLTATSLLLALGLGTGWALRSARVWLPRTAGAAVVLMGSVMLMQWA